jgi:hypothetical protein
MFAKVLAGLVATAAVAVGGATVYSSFSTSTGSSGSCCPMSALKSCTADSECSDAVATCCATKSEGSCCATAKCEATSDCCELGIPDCCNLGLGCCPSEAKSAPASK